jgi:hypothetical protein
MKRLDQGHLYSKLEVPRLTCPGQESNPDLYGGRRALWKRAIRTADAVAIIITIQHIEKDFESEEWEQGKKENALHRKKAFDISVPSRDVTHLTLSGRE